MKKRYIVETHVGVFETWAVSAKKAIANATSKAERNWKEWRDEHQGRQHTA